MVKIPTLCGSTSKSEETFEIPAVGMVVSTERLFPLLDGRFRVTSTQRTNRKQIPPCDSVTPVTRGNSAENGRSGVSVRLTWLADRLAAARSLNWSASRCNRRLNTFEGRNARRSARWYMRTAPRRLPVHTERRTCGAARWAAPSLTRLAVDARAETLSGCHPASLGLMKSDEATREALPPFVVLGLQQHGVKTQCPSRLMKSRPSSGEQLAGQDQPHLDGAVAARLPVAPGPLVRCWRLEHVGRIRASCLLLKGGIFSAGDRGCCESGGPSWWRQFLDACGPEYWLVRRSWRPCVQGHRSVGRGASGGRGLAPSRPNPTAWAAV